jgi:hypothetical protein
MAHFIGKWLKQIASHDTLTSRIFHCFGIVVFALITELLIYLIAQIRQGYLALLEREQVTVGDLLEGRV